MSLLLFLLLTAPTLPTLYIDSIIDQAIAHVNGVNEYMCSAQYSICDANPAYQDLNEECAAVYGGCT